MPGRTSSAMTPPGDVDRVGHQLAGERQPHRPGHGDAGLLLRLVGARRPRCGVTTTLSKSNSGRVGARLLGEDVEAGAGDPALLRARVASACLVDDAAAGGVDDPDRRLDLAQRLLADQADRLGGLGQVHGDEVGSAEQLVEREQLDAELRRPERRCT